MHVVATAGHVDHGKSTLVRALTGMEPDRWEEERRRGLTIDLGFAWTEIDGSTFAFVDVPGHERFVTNMLAGVGPVPAALLVVAADEGWMPQTEEHVAALDALGVAHAVVAITRADLADPRPADRDVRGRLATTSLRAAPTVAVGAPAGLGLDAVRTALSALARSLPAPDPDAPVRLWVDRAFTIRGAGTVVTGTLGAGTIRAGDELVLHGERVGVRGLQVLGAQTLVATPVARVAVNLRGIGTDRVARGDALLSPGAWVQTDLVDTALSGAEELPGTLTLHVGSAAVPARVRPLGPDLARLRLARPLPLRAGDRALLRDPGRHLVAAAVTVLDADPPPLSRRGSVPARVAALRDLDADAELRRRGVARGADLRALGLDPTATPLSGDWLVDPERELRLRAQLADEVRRYADAHPLESGPTVESVRRALGLPDRALAEALVAAPLELREGRVVDPGRAGVPPVVAAAVAELLEELRHQPFVAPDAARLTALGLGAVELAAAQRAGLVLRVSDGVVLAPDADREAATRLGRLPQPFTVSEARRALATTRRVAVPLLELLDRRGLTRRGSDDRRVVLAPSAG